MRWLRDRFLFRPWRDVESTPADAGLAYEDVALVAADGVRLHAWWMPGDGARLALLWLHGNAGNVGHRIPEARQLHALGASLLLLDYRGYGRSEGRPSERGFHDDADAGLAWLEGPGAFPRERIVLYGRSLGASVAVDLAARTPGLAGCVLVTPLTSLRDVAPRILRLPGVRRLAGPGFDTLARIPGVSCPLLIVAGEEDALTPPEMAERLRSAATAPAALHVVPGGGHESTHLVREDGSPGFADTLRGFLGSLGR